MTGENNNDVDPIPVTDVAHARAVPDIPAHVRIFENSSHTGAYYQALDAIADAAYCGHDDTSNGGSDN